jgi:hypothetical protein
MGAAGVLGPFTDDQQEGTPMPKPIPVAAALAATDKKIGVALKLPPIMAKLPKKVRAEIDEAIEAGDYSAAHLARALNLIFAQHGLGESVTDNTVKAYQGWLRGDR